MEKNLLVRDAREYERRGFIRAPELDFSPDQGVLVKGFLRNLYPL
jgi:hypothetical protein